MSESADSSGVSGNLLSASPGTHILRTGYGPGVWPLRERLMLASSVLDPDNQQITWNTVSKRLIDFTPINRDSSWCEARSCAKQYALLLESAEISKRQQQEKNDANLISGHGTVFPIHNTSNFLVKKMSFERVDELNWEMCHIKFRHAFLKKLKDRVVNGELTKEEIKELLSELDTKKSSYVAPESICSDDGKLMNMKADSKDMSELAEQMVQSKVPFAYPDSTWVPSNRKINVPLNIGGMRNMGFSSSGNKLSSMLDAASARRLPSSLAMSKTEYYPQSQRVAKARNVAIRGRRAADSGRSDDPRYRAPRTATTNNQVGRRDYMTKRQRAAMEVYVEENKFDESADKFDTNSEYASDDDSGEYSSEGNSSDNELDENESSEYYSSQPSTPSTVGMMESSTDTIIVETDDQKPKEDETQSPTSTDYDKYYESNYAEQATSSASQSTPMRVVMSQSAGRNLKLKIMTSETLDSSSDVKPSAQDKQSDSIINDSPMYDPNTSSLNSSFVTSSLSCKSTPYRESPSKWCDLARKILDISRRICREYSPRSELGHSLTKLQTYVAQNDFPCGVEFAHEFMSLLAQFVMKRKCSEADHVFIRTLYAKVEVYLVEIASPFMTKVDFINSEADVINTEAIFSSTPSGCSDRYSASANFLSPKDSPFPDESQESTPTSRAQSSSNNASPSTSGLKK